MVADVALISEKALSGAFPAKVEDLTVGERAVALYASDMPDGYRFSGRDRDNGQLLVWVRQGAARLGPATADRQAQFERGYTALASTNRSTPELTAAHRRMFPKPRRIKNAAELAALTAWTTPVSRAAIERHTPVHH